MAPVEHLLVFGASGALGTAVCDLAVRKGWLVTGISRSPPAQVVAGVTYLSLDPLSDRFSAAALGRGYTCVCWAQGSNLNDSVRSVERDRHLELYRANCLYIVETLKMVLAEGALAPASRLCVVSSIWQQLGRQNKLSYCMTKAALEGLVLSASADLASEGHLINAVMPGVVDTPMTRKNLTAAQIESITKGTQFGRLTTRTDVAALVCYLCSPDNTGITGQFIAADLGWSRVRIV